MYWNKKRINKELFFFAFSYLAWFFIFQSIYAII